MLDQRAAFDVVWHSGLFLKLGRLCVVGKMLRTLMASYKNLSCTIKINSHVSDSFPIQRSVRQGGVLSTFYYLAYVDELLNDIANSTLGCRVLSTKCGNPTYEDDIALIALSSLNLQRWST